MSRGLLDTSVFVAFESGRAINTDLLPDDFAVSIVTLAELQVGVLAAKDVLVQGRRMKTYRQALQFNPIEIDQQIADAWATLRVMLRESGRAVEVNDLWIAATAMELQVPLITQNRAMLGLPNIETILV